MTTENGTTPIACVLEQPSTPPPALGEVWGDTPARSYAGPPPAPVPIHASAPTWREHEPKFVHSIKWQDRATGIEHMTVIRADTWDALLPQIQAVTAIAKQHRTVPDAAPDTAVASASATPAPKDPAYCTVHGEWMRQGHDGKSFYHKAGEKADGKALWCRGK